jgi:hypothetical protein
VGHQQCFSNQKNVFMKSIKFFSILLLAVMVAFASCKKDEINDTNVVPDPINPGQVYSNGLIERSVTDEDGLTVGCVVLEYPFSLLLSDSSTVVIASEEDMNEAISDSTNYPIDFVYPLNVTLEDGTSQTVANIEEFSALFAGCVPDTGWGDTSIVGINEFFPAWDISFDNSCIQLVYPVSIVFENGTPVTANNHDELIAYLADGNFYSFVFPVSFENLDGTVTAVTNPEELFDLLAACNPGGGVGGGCNPSGFACYLFSYPITLVNIDGSTITANNDDEFANAVMNGNFYGFQYPITLIAPDSTELVVNNDDELNEALLNCGTVVIGDGGGGGGDTTILDGDFICYDFVFPIQITDFTNGTVTNIADQAAWYDYIASPNNVGFDFVFPLSLSHIETGVVTTVNSMEELGAALEDCF